VVRVRATSPEAERPRDLIARALLGDPLKSVRGCRLHIGGALAGDGVGPLRECVLAAHLGLRAGASMWTVLALNTLEQAV